MVPQVPVQEVDQQQEDDQSEQVDQDQKDQTEISALKIIQDSLDLRSVKKDSRLIINEKLF